MNRICRFRISISLLSLMTLLAASGCATPRGAGGEAGCPKDSQQKTARSPDGTITWCETVSKATGKPEKTGPLSQVDYGGTRVQDSEYENGLPNGRFTIYHFNGKVSEEGTMLAGQRQGAVVKYSPEGKKIESIEYQNGVPGGAWTAWYENGEKRAQGGYEQGKRNGTWKYWYENGQIAAEGFYIAGKLNGRWISYHENGKPWAEGIYEDDIPIRLWITWDKDGKELSRETFDDRDKIRCSEGPGKGELMSGSEPPRALSRRCEKEDKQGLFVGYRTDWYPNGKKEIETGLHDGSVDGESRHWFDNGQLQELMHFRKGKAYGPWKEWYRNGKPRVEGAYSDFQKDGEFTFYYDNGQKHSQGRYSKDARSGLWQFWSSQGQLMGKYVFTAGPPYVKEIPLPLPAKVKSRTSGRNRK